MESRSLKAKANYFRVCHLLVDETTNALRNALHAVHPPSTLASVLNANKKTLQRIRYSVIKAWQWDLLFPTSGAPDSNNFDITLLTVLLRNICGLSAPATGWNVMPPVSDISISANILRVQMFKNKVYGHIPTAGLDDVTFETLWNEISVLLVNMGIPENDIDELKLAPLSPEEESYIERLKEWKQQDDDVMSKFSDFESEVHNLDVYKDSFVRHKIPNLDDHCRLVDFSRKIDKTPFEKSNYKGAEEFKNLDITRHKLIFDGPLTWRLNERKHIDLHALLFKDLLVLLQKEDDKYVLKCQSISMRGYEDDKTTRSPVLKLSTVHTRNSARDENAFFVVGTSDIGPQIYELVAETSVEREAWLKYITEAIEFCQERR
ncbi:uncharacterized protein LOC114526192 [Dendronephthya gigantea]|uniref:uncharacterized protein LOC114526192 n=1 Tax=Dendronephthya gigantea TaxID=151771 RepID=UPI00106A773D|nr:uncharacterized protein LOC114526192 [Dendronephthya gigantea]